MESHLTAWFIVFDRPVPKTRLRVSQDPRDRNWTHADARTVEHEALIAGASWKRPAEGYVNPAWWYRGEREFYGAHAAAGMDRHRRFDSGRFGQARARLNEQANQN